MSHLDKAERKRLIAALPRCSNYYTFDFNHVDVCSCCQQLRSIKEKDKIKSRRYVEKNKLGPQLR